MIRIGIDIGGTFTDLCVMTAQGDCWSSKLLTTPHDPSSGFLQILQRAFEADPAYRDVSEIVHATTIATNAILENNTARMGLITTAGFRDVLEIGRHFRRDIYNLFLEKPPVLIPRRLRLEVNERVGAGGEVIVPLDEEQVREAAQVLAREHVEVILICFLHSYSFPSHEIEAANIIRRHCDIPIIASHLVCREYREYERFSTAAVHGAVLPKVSQYVRNIRSGLQESHVKAPLAIMQSNGGMAAAGTILDQPGSIVESGPAAGVIAAVEVGRRLGFSNLLSFDMGGTTAKATLIKDGCITINNNYEVGGGIQGGFGTGYPIRTPVVDLVEIGTGGGSIAYTDEAGHLHVGPRSAGASPGPVCYGQGGKEPTVTDADALLGRLLPSNFADKQFSLDSAAAHRAIECSLAEPLSFSVLQAAEGVVALANEQMVRALQLVSVERGFDPRDFTLVAFGGAGPMHAAEIAASLGCSRVVIPTAAGVLSAWGLLVADARRDASQTILLPGNEIDMAALRTVYTTMIGRLQEELIHSGFDEHRLTHKMGVDVRYAGQAFEVSVELPEEPVFDDGTKKLVNDLFHANYLRLYGHNDPKAETEWVTLRAASSSAVPRPVNPTITSYNQPLEQRQLGTQVMTWNGCAGEAPIYERQALGQGDRFSGPALIVQPDSAIAVPPGVELIVEDTGDISLLIGSILQ